MSRWWKILLAAVLVLAAGIALSPWWLGAALRPALRAQGVTFQRYERMGYSQFALVDVVFTHPGFHLKTARVTAPTPLAWLGQRARAREPVVRLERWQLTRTAGQTPAAPGPKSLRGFPDLFATLQKVMPQVSRWLPQAELTDGALSGLGPRLTVARVRWGDSRLAIDGLGVVGRRLSGVFAVDRTGSFTLTAQTAENDARLKLGWDGDRVTGEALLWEQPLQLSAHFPAVGWIPDEAHAAADNWRVSAARIKLGAPYAEVRGDARLIWKEGRLEVTLDATAEAAPDTRNAPPFSVQARAHGTMRELTLTHLTANTPFATAELTAPITLSLDHPPAGETARLQLKADLAKLPWAEARGLVDGTVTVIGETAVTRQDFSLSFRDVSVGGVALKAAQARGHLAWPMLELDEIAAQLDETSALTARGTVNWKTREFHDVDLTATAGSAWFARWLPANLRWDRAEVSASLAGPFAQPRHHGTLQLLAVQGMGLHPVTFEATWRGEAARAELSAKAAAEDSAIELAGTLARDGLELTDLRFRPDGAEGLKLAAPARVHWAPHWRAEQLQLRGPAGEIQARGEGGAEPRFELFVKHFPSRWLEDWVTLAGPAWKVEQWHLRGQRQAGALAFETELGAQIEMSSQPADVRLAAQGDGGGIMLKELSVAASGRTLTRATGRLPVVFLTDAPSGLSFNETAPLEFTASTETDSPLWATLAGVTGLELTAATAHANLTGTLREPAGEIRLTVDRLALAEGRLRFPVPELTGLNLAVDLKRDAVTLRSFRALVDGQRIEGEGRLPMDDDRWRQVWRAPGKLDWRAATARVEIPDADLGVIARRFPAFIAAQGRLQTRLELARGKLTGSLQLADAATRPRPPLGTLKEINAHLDFADRTITVRSFTATLGGEPVRVEGSVTLEPAGRPRLALGLQGRNLPLVRSTGLLLRTDLDLRADSTADGATRLSGTVNVRDCLVLASVNLRDLLPSGRRGVSRQPPYFSVGAEPFARWLLAVALRAPGTLRLRTTVYNGIASASFQLSGTLGEPRAVGELTVDEGEVLFPFATFDVQQGNVRLRESDPYHAVVSLNAIAQRRDHQLRLELSGELPSPNLVLSSTPAMESGDVLLMVMTGQAPPGDALASNAAGPRLAMLGAYLGRGLFQDLGFGGEDRLEFTAGERVSRDGRETYAVEYKLGGRWSLQGEYDEFDAYNAGLKWRVYTEESIPDAPK